MAASLSTFEIRILRRAADESWTDEALVIIDGRDQLASLGREASGRIAAGFGTTWIGRRPDVVVGAESPLLPRAEPHEAFIARCGCGEEGCGALVARITRSDEVVLWDRIREGSDARADEFPINSEEFVFDARQYEEAVLGRAEPATSWRPTTRRAALMVAQRLRGWRNDDLRLRFAGVDDLGDDAVRLGAMFGQAGEPDRAILKRTFRLEPDESADALAERVVLYATNGEMVADELVERSPFS